jgi:hypothetical protein
VPDGVGAEGALVEVRVAVHGALGAEGLVTGLALFALEAAVVEVAPADGVAFDEVLDFGADLLGFGLEDVVA